MKTIVVTLTMYGIAYVGFAVNGLNRPYIIQRGDDIIVVSNMPEHTISEAITNSFVYIDGEYISPPYIVSVSNLAVYINGHVVQNFEPMVHERRYYSGRVGVTPESVGKSVDALFESYTGMLKDGTAAFFKNGSLRRGYAIGDGDGGASSYVEKAKKAMRGDGTATAELISDMRLEGARVRPDWIQRLASNTNLEVRAARILEAKRQRERKEQERREQQEQSDKR